MKNGKVNIPKVSIITCSIRPSGLDIVQQSLAKQTFKEWEWLVELSVPEMGYDLNKAYNRALRRASGSLVVSWQDFISAPPDTLQKFWDAHQQNPDTFFTAPVGKVDKLGDEPRCDWRTEREDIHWQEWEIDMGAAPLKCLKIVGGFDEEMDKETWTFDACSVSARAAMEGYKFKCLKDIRTTAIDHDKFLKHPFRESMYNPDFYNQRLEQFRHGLRINYL